MKSCGINGVNIDKTLFIGLTGGVGCGKSTVLAIFGDLGWNVIDADKICGEFYTLKDRRVVDPQIARWGESRVLSSDGSVNRKNIADIVFNDRAELAWLNSLLHPVVLEEAQRRRSLFDGNLVMFDVPLLFEAGWELNFDRTLSVWADRDTCCNRLLQRGWNMDEIDRRMMSQFSPEEKLEKADFGIINTGALDGLRIQCETINTHI